MIDKILDNKNIEVREMFNMSQEVERKVFSVKSIDLIDLKI